MHIHQQRALFSNADTIPAGAGWETVTPEAFNALRAAGWTPQEYVDAVPRRAFFLELNSRGVTRAQLRTLIEQLIADPTAREDALIELDTAQTVERANPLVALIGAHLQYTDAQLDALFLSAAAR